MSNKTAVPFYTEDIVVVRQQVGNETRTYAGVISKAPAWAADPGVDVRLNGVHVDRFPNVYWDVCSTGRENCRGICCR